MTPAIAQSMIAQRPFKTPSAFLAKLHARIILVPALRAFH